MSSLSEVDSFDLIEFAKKYSEMGTSLQDQLDVILDGDVEKFDHEVNPNAVKLIKETLEELNYEISVAIQAYEDWYFKK